jgi:hypothetical protein
VCQEVSLNKEETGWFHDPKLYSKPETFD